MSCGHTELPCTQMVTDILYRDIVDTCSPIKISIIVYFNAVSCTKETITANLLVDCFFSSQCPYMCVQCNNTYYTFCTRGIDSLPVSVKQPR